MDPIDYLLSQHGQVDELFTEFEAGLGPQAARDVFERIEQCLSGHAAIEEMHVYPLLRDRLAHGDEIAERAIAEQQVLKEALKAMETLDAGTSEFDTAMRRLIGATRAHVEEEEAREGPFQRLRRKLTPGERDVLFERLERSMQLAPTRAHPLAPDRPPANRVAGPAAGVVDRARDALSGRARRIARG